MIKIKILFYVALFIAIAPVVYSDFGIDAVGGGGEGFIRPAGGCMTARFCGEEELRCDYSGDDDICPENYGDWSECRTNNYGTKCWECDPDCGNCGQGIGMYVFDSVKNSLININVWANGYPEDGNRRNKFKLFSANGDEENNGQGNEGNAISNEVDAQCQGPRCSYNFINVVRSPNNPCKSYSYYVRFKVPGNNNDDSHFYWGGDTGYTAPDISVADIDENSNFNINADCTGGDELVDGEGLIIYLYLERLINNEFVHIDSNGRDCNIPLSSGGCPLGSLQGTRTNNFVYNFNSANFDMGHYRLNAFVKPYIILGQGEANLEIMDNYPPGYASAEFDIEDQGQFYQGSKVLNIILAKIKTWL